MTHEARELEVYIPNERRLQNQYNSINKNLITKKAQGKYQHALAVKLFMYLVDNGAKMYQKEFGGPVGEWNKTFPKSARLEVAEALTKYFEVEAGYGNYDNYLPKKYRTSNPSPITAKKTRGGYIVSIRVPSLDAAKKLARRM